MRIEPNLQSTLKFQYVSQNRVEPAQSVYLLATIRIEPVKPKKKGKKKKKRKRGKLELALAGYEWRAAVLGLKPLRLPRARSPCNGEGGEW